MAALWIRRTFSLSRRVTIAAALLPKRYWFRCALVASWLQARATAAVGGNGKFTELMMRDHWLRELTRHGAYPIPHRVHGGHVLQLCEQGPVIYCSTHLANFEVCLRSLLELGHTAVAIADPGRVEASGYPVIGLDMHLPVIEATASTLWDARRALAAGHSVVFTADREYLDTDLSNSLLRLAARMRVPVVFSWAKLGADNVFDVMMQTAPPPAADELQTNMNFLRDLQRQIRSGAGLADERGDVVNSLPSHRTEPAAAQVSSSAA